MQVDRRLRVLRQSLQRAPKLPAGRTVVMVTRVKSATEVNTTELRAKDYGARVPGGCVLPIWHDHGDMLEIITWNTGEASDLRKYGNKTHAEAQLYEFIRGRVFGSIEIEISHSPCTACTDMLVNWLKTNRELGKMASREPNRRIGHRVYIGSDIVKLPDLPAVIRWGKLYDMPPQATTWYSLKELHDVGWTLMAPGTALPPGVGETPVTLL